MLDEEKWVKLKNLELLIFLDETGINRDSAILIKLPDNKTKNDCKLHDKVKYIKKIYGKIDIFTCQFTGATMHPICYQYSKKDKKISSKKRNDKFNGVLKSINDLNPEYYIPSAGPACFLNDKLFHLNLENFGVFAKSWDFIFLKRKGLEKKDFS